MLSLVFKIRKKFYFSILKTKQTNKQKTPHKAEELKGGRGCSTLYVDLGLFVALNRNSVVHTLGRVFSAWMRWKISSHSKDVEQLEECISGGCVQ